MRDASSERGRRSSDPAPSPAGKGGTDSESAPACAAYWDFCPNCGARLINQGCKYRCPQCHYFMSCSDFD